MKRIKMISFVIAVLMVFTLGMTACSNNNNNDDMPEWQRALVDDLNNKRFTPQLSEVLPDSIRNEFDEGEIDKLVSDIEKELENADAAKVNALSAASLSTIVPMASKQSATVLESALSYHMKIIAGARTNARNVKEEIDFLCEGVAVANQADRTNWFNPYANKAEVDDSQSRYGMRIRTNQTGTTMEIRKMYGGLVKQNWFGTPVTSDYNCYKKCTINADGSTEIFMYEYDSASPYEEFILSSYCDANVFRYFDMRHGEIRYIEAMLTDDSDEIRKGTFVHLWGSSVNDMIEASIFEGNKTEAFVGSRLGQLAHGGPANQNQTFAYLLDGQAAFIDTSQADKFETFSAAIDSTRINLEAAKHKTLEAANAKDLYNILYSFLYSSTPFSEMYIIVH